jgi:hypothetical protein
MQVCGLELYRWRRGTWDRERRSESNMSVDSFGDGQPQMTTRVGNETRLQVIELRVKSERSSVQRHGLTALRRTRLSTARKERPPIEYLRKSSPSGSPDEKNQGQIYNQHESWVHHV